MKQYLYSLQLCITVIIVIVVVIIVIIANAQEKLFFSLGTGISGLRNSSSLKVHVVTYPMGTIDPRWGPT